MLAKIFHSKAVGAASAWLTLGSAVMGATYFLPEWFGELTVAQRVIVSSGAALGILLILALIFALAGYAFRKFWPVPSDPASADREPTQDDTGLHALVRSLEEKNKAIIEDYQRMLGVEARLAQEIDGTKTAIQALDKQTSDHFFIIGRETGDSLKAVRAELNTAFLAFQAIRDREKHIRLSAAIDREADFLTRNVLAGKQVAGDDWQEWLSHKVTYDSAFGHWSTLARSWLPGVPELVERIDPKNLTDKGFDYVEPLLEDTKAVTTYKLFALRHSNWLPQRDRLAIVLDMAAFSGPAATENLERLMGTRR